MADSIPMFRSLRSVSLAAALAFASPLGIAAAEPAAAPEGPAPEHALDLLLASGPGSEPVALRIGPTRDGKPWTQEFRMAVDRLFDFLDRDGDGSLSAAESARLPMPFEVRRLLWGACFPPAGGADAKAADASGDGRIDRGELWNYYDRRSVGLTAAAGRAPLSDRLTARLVERLDRDEDGKVSAAELDGAWKILVPLDLNEDELVSPGELLGGALYPGAVGGTLLLPREGASGRQVALDAPPPRSEAAPPSGGGADSDTAAGPLAKAAAGAPRLTWEAAVPVDGSAVAAPPRAERLPGLRVLFWTDEGGAPKAVAVAARSFRDQFGEADADRDGRIGAAEVQRNQRAPLRNLIAFADRNGDAVLTEAELDAYLDLSTALARGQTLVTVLDYGKGFFEALDEDASGALSAAELGAARERLTGEGAFQEGALQVDRLPRTVRVAVACGHPRTAFPASPPRGPAWFAAMDRNGDGAVSRREFLGGDAPFAKLDRDGDGVVSLQEGESTAQPAPAANPKSE